MNNYIVFTDLDGTLLDYDTYEWKDAQKSLNFLKKNFIPIIPITSKTKSETLTFIEKLKLKERIFSVENGGAIYFPKDFNGIENECVYENEFCKIEIGIHIDQILPFLNEVSSKSGVKIKTIFEFSDREMKEILNLTEEMSLKAKEREYDIPFIIVSEEIEKINTFLREIENSEFKLVKGGRFYHISGDYDKGIAAKRILEIFRKKWKKDFKTIGLGDSENDLSLLKFADIPVLVRKKSGEYSEKIKKEVKNLFLTKKPAPSGWNEIFEKLFFI